MRAPTTSPSPCRSHSCNGDPLNADAPSPVQDRLLQNQSTTTIPSPCRSHCCNGDPLNADAPSPVKHRLLQNQSTTTIPSPCRSHCCNGDPLKANVPGIFWNFVAVTYAECNAVSYLNHRRDKPVSTCRYALPPVVGKYRVHDCIKLALLSTHSQ